MRDPSTPPGPRAPPTTSASSGASGPGDASSVQAASSPSPSSPGSPATARPELDEHWLREYPEVGTASAKIAVLEASGYSPLGYFALPESCWLDSYYRPLQDRCAAFLARHDHSQAARDLVEADQREIDLYQRFSSFVSYGYYVARRTPA